MEIVKLKSEFILSCVKEDAEFLEKTSRPYVVKVRCNRTGKLYAIPMSTKNKKHSFKLDSGSYLNYEKTFEIRNFKIVEKSYRFRDSEMYLHRELKKQEMAIEKSFNKYLESHPERFSVNESTIIKIQNKF